MARLTAMADSMRAKAEDALTNVRGTGGRPPKRLTEVEVVRVTDL